MQEDRLLKQHIKTIDHFFCSDIWNLIEAERLPLSKVEIQKDDKK